VNRVTALLLAGWLAESLAGPDREVEAAIEAYRAADYDEALARLDSAESERGEKPELRYNRGLVLAAQGELEPARKAFERGTESEDRAVRASSAYELGNLDFDTEDYAAAIERYIECLKADPAHEKAKWNLEIAKFRLEQEEKEKEEKEDEDSEGDGDGDQQDSGDGDENSDEEDQGGDGDGDESGESGESSESGDSGDGDGDGDGDGGEESGDGDGDGDEQKGDEQKGDEQKGDEQKGDEQKGDEQEGDAQSQPAQPIQKADLSQALEDLDQQDNFMLGRPQGGGKKKVKQDW
jgi:Ca-activated chloride channel family protein